MAEWSDRAVVIGLRQHGETGIILDALTREHGRHAGFVHGGRSRRFRAVLQPGNGVDLAWRSRLDDQLGHYTVEPLRMRAAVAMASAAALQAVNHLCALMRLLADREPHSRLFDRLDTLLDAQDDPLAASPDMARFEFDLLGELGFGLDVSCCAATGVTEDLAFVSPRTGRAVSRTAGEPWRDRLLPLPAFLLTGHPPSGPDDLAAAFRLTAFFLERDLFGPRGQTLPDARGAYLRCIGL